jgi:hypothetical protein
MRKLKLFVIPIACLALSNMAFGQTKNALIGIKEVGKKTKDLYQKYALQKPVTFKKLTPEKDSTEEYSRNDSATFVTDIIVNGPFINGTRRQTTFWFLEDKMFQVYVRMIKDDKTIAFGNYFYNGDSLYYKYEETGMQNNANSLLEQSNVYLAKGKQLLEEYKKAREQ